MNCIRTYRLDKKLFKCGDAPKKELEGIRKIYDKKYKEHLQKINRVFKL